MKHTVCQVATFEHAKCKYVLYDYHILMHSGNFKMYRALHASHHSTISILADLMTLLYLYLKIQFLECENPIVHTVQIDISALIALMKRNLRQVGTCWVLTVGRVDKLGLLEYAKLIYCKCVCGNIERSYQTYTCSQTRCKDYLRDTGKCWILHNMDQFNCIML